MATLLWETNNLDEAMTFESAGYEPGTYEMRIDLLRSLTNAELEEVRTSMASAPIPVSVSQTSTQLHIIYTVPEPEVSRIAQWQILLIPLIPTFIWGVVGGIALFQLQKIITLSIILLGGLIALGLIFSSQGVSSEKIRAVRG